MTTANGILETRNGAPKHSPAMNTANSNGHDRVNSSSSDSDSPTRRRSDPRPAYKRKMSTPLAPPFMVSAPGKVIVYGEHAVVHGKVALLRQLPSLYTGG